MQHAGERPERQYSFRPLFWLFSGYQFLLSVLVHREMEKLVSRDTEWSELKITWVRFIALVPIPKGRQGGIMPPPFGLGPWVGARVVSPTLPYPPPRPSFIVGPHHYPGNGLSTQGYSTARAASRAALRRSRATCSFRSRSAKITSSRPASLSAGAT